MEEVKPAVNVAMVAPANVSKRYIHVGVDGGGNIKLFQSDSPDKVDLSDSNVVWGESAPRKESK